MSLGHSGVVQRIYIRDQPPDIRDHPDYGRGFSDRWNGAKEPKDNLATYMAGWNAVEDVERVFREAGFEKRDSAWIKPEPSLVEKLRKKLVRRVIRSSRR